VLVFHTRKVDWLGGAPPPTPPKPLSRSDPVVDGGFDLRTPSAQEAWGFLSVAAPDRRFNHAPDCSKNFQNEARRFAAAGRSYASHKGSAERQAHLPNPICSLPSSIGPTNKANKQNWGHSCHRLWPRASMQRKNSTPRLRPGRHIPQSPTPQMPPSPIEPPRGSIGSWKTLALPRSRSGARTNQLCCCGFLWIVLFAPLYKAAISAVSNRSNVSASKQMRRCAQGVHTKRPFRKD
jgi:hypothetical protein